MKTSGCANTINSPARVLNHYTNDDMAAVTLHMRRHIRYRSIIGLYINRCSPSPYKVYGNIHQCVVIRNSTWLIE